jgi:hypothetical protein
MERPHATVIVMALHLDTGRKAPDGNCPLSIAKAGLENACEHVSCGKPVSPTVDYETWIDHVT